MGRKVSCPGRWWRLAAAASALVAVLAVPLATAAPSTADAAAALHRFEPVAPRRVMDSRTGLGHAGAFAARETATLDLTTVLPVDAVAVALNVTATDAAGPLFVTAWGDGERPTASSLNVEAAGQTIANLVTVPVAAGRLSIYTSAPVHLVADLAGWYVPAVGGVATAGRYELVGPARVLDTRALGSPRPGRVGVGGEVTVDLTAVGVPADAGAALVNLTVTEASGPGYWTAYPSGTPRPAASSVNVDRAGQTIANQAVVALTGGSFTVFAQAGGHLVVDVSGYFTGAGAAATSDGLFVPERPRRLLDTRNGNRPTVGTDVRVVVSGAEAARAFATNLTLTDVVDGGYLSAWAGAGAWPGVSSINASHRDQTIANHAVVAAVGDRFALRIAVRAHVVVDVVGWYTGGTAVDPGWAADPPAPGTQGPPANVPPSSPSAPYAFLFAPGAGGALPSRWNPCEDIDFLVNWGAGPPAGAAQALAEVVAHVGDVTGLRLVDRGSTTVTTDDPYPTGIEAVIEFTSLGRPGPAGLGGGGGTVSTTPGVYGQIMVGGVQINTDYTFVPGWGGNGFHVLFAHEIGHMLGLAHVDSVNEVMYPVMQPHESGFEEGDINGLRYLYGGGCASVSAVAEPSAVDAPTPTFVWAESD